MAAAWQARGERPNEIAAIEQALTLNPDWGEALRRLSDAQRAASDLEAAQATLRKAIAREPQNVTHQGELADVLWTQGRRSEAIAAMREAVSREPCYQWGWRKLRDWSHVVRDPEMVVDLGRDIVRQRPQSAACWMLLAEILEDSPEHRDECLQAVDRTVELDPRRVEAHALRADLLARVGQFDEAVAACRPPVFAAERPAFLRVKEADIESQRGNVHGAVEQMKSVVADDPEYAIGWSRLADWYDSLGDHENYLHAAENLVRIDPRHAVPWGYLGDAMLRAGRRDEAKTHLHKALDLDPAYAFAALRLFELHLEDREYDEALAAIRTAAPQLPDDLRMASEVRALAAKGDCDAAEQQLAGLCRCEMDDASLLQRAVEAMGEASAAGQAEAVLAGALDDPQASPLVAAAWVRHAARDGKHRLIRQKLRALADRDDRWHVLSRAYVSQLAERRQDQRLHGFVRKHRARLHADTRSWAAVGSALRDLSRDKEVIRWMGDWRTRDDVQSRMLFPLVLSHLADRSERRAAEVANHALSLTIDDSFEFYLIWLAAIGLLSGDLDAAFAHFSRINPSAFSDYYQQLYGLLKATLEVLSGDPARGKWPAARRQLETARSGIRPENWSDRVVQRLFWRCRELAARHCGKTLPAFSAKLARMLR